MCCTALPFHLQWNKTIIDPILFSSVVSIGCIKTLDKKVLVSKSFSS